jgi:HEAT repeat protein
MQIRNTLLRPGGPLLLFGVAILFTTFGPAPAARAQMSPPVEALRRALDELLPPPDLTDEFNKALQERAKTLKQLTDDNSPLKSLGDMAQALLLQNWKDDQTALTSPPESKVNREAREALVQRFLRGVQAAIKAGEAARDPDLRAAVATQVGEFAASTRSGFFGNRGGNSLLLQHLPQFTRVVAGLAESDRSPEVRAAAASALAKLQSDPVKAGPPPKDDVVEPPTVEPVTVPALRTMLKDRDVEVRRAAARALGDLLRGTRAADRGGFAATPMVEPSRDNLVQFGPQVAQAAGAGLTDAEGDAEVRRLCAEALLQVAVTLRTKLRAGGEAVATTHRQLRPVANALWDQLPALTRATRDDDPRVRRAAMRVFEEMGDVRFAWAKPQELLPIAPTPDVPRPPVKPIVPPRTEARPEDVSGLSLVYAVEQAPPAKPRDEPPPVSAAVAGLVRRLSDDDVRNRLAAIDALEAIMTPTGTQTVSQEVGKEAVAVAAKALTRALSDRDRFVRWAAARTLGKMAPLSDAENGPQVQYAAVAGLARLLSDPDPDVRLRVALALEHFGKGARDAVPALAVAASRGDREARISASHAIEVIGGSPAEAVPALAAGLTDSNVRLRRTVASALAAYGADAVAARAALNRALRDSDPEVRRLASDALIKIGTRR